MSPSAIRARPTGQPIRALLASVGIVALAIAVPGEVTGVHATWLSWIISAVSLLLGVIAVRLGARLLAAVLAGVAVLFNPWYPLHLARSAWIIADLAVIAVYLACLTGYPVLGMLMRQFGGPARRRERDTGHPADERRRFTPPGRKTEFPRYPRGMRRQKPDVKVPGFPSSRTPRWIPRSRRPARRKRR